MNRLSLPASRICCTTVDGATKPHLPCNQPARLDNRGYHVTSVASCIGRESARLPVLLREPGFEQLPGTGGGAAAWRYAAVPVAVAVGRGEVAVVPVRVDGIKVRLARQGAQRPHGHADPVAGQVGQ